MKPFNSRRFWIGLAAVASLLVLGLLNHADVAWPLASIAVGIGAADATEKLRGGPDVK